MPTPISGQLVICRQGQISQGTLTRLSLRSLASLVSFYQKCSTQAQECWALIGYSVSVPPESRKLNEWIGVLDLHAYWTTTTTLNLRIAAPESGLL